MQQIDQNSNYRCAFDFALIYPIVKCSNILNAEFIYRLRVLYVDPKQSDVCKLYSYITRTAHEFFYRIP